MLLYHSAVVTAVITVAIIVDPTLKTIIPCQRISVQVPKPIVLTKYTLYSYADMEIPFGTVDNLDSKKPLQDGRTSHFLKRASQKHPTLVKKYPLTPMASMHALHQY